MAGVLRCQRQTKHFPLLFCNNDVGYDTRGHSQWNITPHYDLLTIHCSGWYVGLVRRARCSAANRRLAVGEKTKQQQ